MAASTHAVTLTPEQIDQVDAQLSALRHDVNNQLSLIVAAAELMRRRPEQSGRLIESLSGPTDRISSQIRTFSDFLEQALRIGKMSEGS